MKLPLNVDLGLLILRLSAGGMMLFGHGWGKIVNFSNYSNAFPDPLGISAPVSMALAVFAEALCALLVMIGFKTRLAVVPLIVTMFVAGVIVHADDPWNKKELAMFYLTVYAGLFFTGGGKYSVEKFLKR